MSAVLLSGGDALAQGSVATDRAALVALYNATDGANWTNNTHWSTTRPLSDWYGVTTDANGRVTRLSLSRNALSGEIPAELGNLENLQKLILGQNALSGAIPVELGNLGSLLELHLDNNALSGAIPAELGNLGSLRSLYLWNNELSGAIPVELGRLTNLQELALTQNMLTGAIPVELGGLTHLADLYLQQNQLSGPIPAELGNLGSLQNLSLAINTLTGDIPVELTNLANLQVFDIYNTGLCVTPGSAVQMWLAAISFHGSVCGVEALTDREVLVALYNATDGANWTNNTNWLSTAPLSDWYGVNTAHGRVTLLSLAQNGLAGTIPVELGSLTHLADLYLQQNQLSGPIPAELGNIVNLLYLYLQQNQLSGPIPAELGDLTNLQLLYLSANGLSGEIPAELGNLANLWQLYLWGNELSGAIPAELGNLDNLQRLYLDHNQLTGVIPTELGGLTSLLYLSLWSNQLSGSIPAGVGVAADRGALEGFYDATDGPNWAVGTNWLSGAPLSAWHGVTTGADGRVTELSLSGNQLTGTIPVALEQLENLEQLILSGNDELTGQLPEELRHLSNLGILNVSRTNVCTPTNAAFRAWLATITFQGGTVCDPPAAPRNLTTMAGNARVTLAWTKGDDGGSTITKHQIQQKEGSAAYGDWMDIPDSAAGQKNQASHIVTGLTNGTDYAFQVRAVNDEGESDASVEATATPMAIPALTVSVTITPVEIVVDEGRNAEFTLLRSGSAAGALDVELTVRESGDMLHSRVPQRITIPAGASRVTLTVQTVNDSEDERNSVVAVTVVPVVRGAPDNVAMMTVRDNDRTPPRPPGGGGGRGGGGPRTSVPGAPRNLTAVGGDGLVVLSWEAPARDGGAAITDYEYRIDRRNPWISTGSTETIHTVTGLVNGTAYVFEVRAVNRIGKSFSSNRAEAMPVAPEVFTLDFAHFANGTSITSDLVFVNLSTQPARPAIYFYGTEGALVSAESLVDVTGNLEITEDGGLTVQTEMEPLGELTIATHGQGELVSGSVTVVSNAPLGGMLRFDLPGIGEAVVGASPPVSDTIFPVRRREGGITTGVAVHNLEEEAMDVSCRLMSGGVLLEEVEIPLEANGQTSWLIDQAFPAADTSDFAGAVRCDAPGRRRFSAVALEVDPGTRIFTTLPVFPVDRRGGGREAALDFAHFANGDGTTSDLVFVNMKTQPSGPAPTPFHVAIPPIRPAIYFYDTEGNPIAAESVVDVTGDLEITEDGGLTVQTEMEPLGVLTVSTHGQGALVSGSVKVLSDGPLGGMLRFNLPHIGEAVVGASPPLGDAIFPVRRREEGGTTGVALHNLESSPGLVHCDLMREGVLRDTASFPLEANGQTSWLIDATFPAADTSDFVGSVRCDAVGEGRFSAVALEMDPGTRVFTTLPVFPVPEMPPQE